MRSERLSDRRRDLEQADFEDPGHVAFGAARAQLVNRTHRVVRERAQSLKSQRSRGRSLWIPMAVSSAFLLILCTAIWSLLDQYDMTPNGVPDASSQIFIFLLWFFPVSAAILALAWAHRAHADREPTE